MGMFDEVSASCPQCGEWMEPTQSKAGACLLDLYTIGLDQIPHDIALDIDGNILNCNNCGYEGRIKTVAITHVFLERS